MEKLRIAEKNKYNYLLKNSNGEVFFINMEFYDTEEPNVNDYIYLPKEILNTKNIYSFGKLTTDTNKIKEEDLIKIISNDKEYYLERYYG